MNAVQPIRILFVEDRPEDVELACKVLSGNALKPDVIRVETKPDFLSQLTRFDPHLIISDYSMPEFDGLSALRLTLEITPHIPVIILTGSINEQTAVECMKSGATDYILKDNMTRLPYAVAEALEKHRIMAERTKALAALQISEKKYRGIFESIQDVYFEISSDGILRELSPSVEILSRGQYTPEDLIGENILSLYADGRTHDPLMEYILQNGTVTDYEINLKNRDGSVIPCSISSRAVPGNEPGSLKIIGTIRDASERNRYETELIHAKEQAEESDRLKSAFLANISHEVRTPLNGILGFAELLRDPELEASERDQFTTILNNCSTQLLHVMTDIVEISRIEAGQDSILLKEVDLQAVLDDISDFFTPQASLKKLAFSLRREAIPADAVFMTDDRKFRQILVNLIGNAFKFTSSGSVTVTCSLPDREWLQIEVRDTGIGIGPEILPAIFERFRQAEMGFSRTYGGTGLGLTISKAYTEMLGGHITVHSTPGEGSLFTIRIPFRRNLQPVTPAPDLPELPAGYAGTLAGKTILVAEDDDNNALYFEQVLADTGARLLMAENGQKAVDLFRENPMVDLVLMDIKMPVLDGVAATAEIKKIKPGAVVFALTAYALAGEEANLRNQGFQEYISKPVSRKDLLATIFRYLISPAS